MSDKLIVTISEITEVPAGFKPIDVVPGPAAYEYIIDVTKLETMVADPRYLGSFVEVYGYLSLFTDDSSLRTEAPDKRLVGTFTDRDPKV